MMQQDFSHAEERAVNHDYAKNPAPEIAREVVGLRNFGGLDGDGLPAGYVRHNFAIERDEDAVRFAGGEESDGDPDQGGEQRGGENILGENYGVRAGEKSWRWTSALAKPSQCSARVAASAVTIAEISLQALMRHQYQRSMYTLPVPAPT